ncbi:MAG: hypothetical protein E6J43_12655 [Chloroflexi bacterium]|nr:MAG: hypothetical protein E6J43_12655 [Chloroflexota bacterium]
MSRAAVLTAPLLTFALVACGGGGNVENTDVPPNFDIRGRVTQITTAEDDTGYSSAWVRINQSTTIRWSTPGDAATATIAELEPGMRVEVRFSGAVALSDPVQATAAEITIID